MITTLERPTTIHLTKEPDTNLSLLAHINMAGRDLVLKSAVERRFPKNHILFHEGDSVNFFYIVKSGMLRTCRSGSNSKEHILDIYRAGDIVGLRETLAGGNHPHSCVCMHETIVAVIDATIIFQLLQIDPHFNSFLFMHLAKESRSTEDRLYSLATKSVHERLAELIMQMHEKNNGKEFAVDFTREAMASMLGTSTETVVRALSDFKARQWIATSKETMRVLNPHELSKLASLSDAFSDSVAV